MGRHCLTPWEVPPPGGKAGQGKAGSEDTSGGGRASWEPVQVARALCSERKPWTRQVEGFQKSLPCSPRL